MAGAKGVERGWIIATLLLSGCRPSPPPLFDQAPTPDACHGVHVSHPVLSPDGRWMVFLSDLTGSYELYLHETTSGRIERLTRNEAFEGSVSWAPDSQAFAFWALFEGDEDFEGYRFDLRTRAPTRIVQSPGNDSDLSWSPDGRRIFYQSERSGNREVASGCARVRSRWTGGPRDGVSGALYRARVVGWPAG